MVILPLRWECIPWFDAIIGYAVPILDSVLISTALSLLWPYLFLDGEHWLIVSFLCCKCIFFNHLLFLLFESFHVILILGFEELRDECLLCRLLLILNRIHFWYLIFLNRNCWFLNNLLHDNIFFDSIIWFYFRVLQHFLIFFLLDIVGVNWWDMYFFLLTWLLCDSMTTDLLSWWAWAADNRFVLCQFVESFSNIYSLWYDMFFVLSLTATLEFLLV